MAEPQARRHDSESRGVQMGPVIRSPARVLRDNSASVYVYIRRVTASQDRRVTDVPYELGRGDGERGGGLSPPTLINTSCANAQLYKFAMCIRETAREGTI